MPDRDPVAPTPYDGGHDVRDTAGDVGEGSHSAVEAEAAPARVPAPSGREAARPDVPAPVDRTDTAALDHLREVMGEAAKVKPPTVDRCVVGRLDALDGVARLRAADALDSMPPQLLGVPVIVDADLPPNVIEFRLGDDVVERIEVEA